MQSTRLPAEENCFNKRRMKAALVKKSKVKHPAITFLVFKNINGFLEAKIKEIL